MPALPPYRLQTLLEVRQRKKEAAEQAFSQAMAALAREQKRLAEMEVELTRMAERRLQRRREYLEKAMQGDMSAIEVTGSNTYLERLLALEEAHKEAIVGQKAIIAQRQEDVDAAREELLRANQDLKALEKHRETWLESVKKARQAHEEQAMDEVAQNTYLRRSGGAGGGRDDPDA